MYNKTLVFLLLFICNLSQAQVGGQNVYQFKDVVTAPRQAALGGKNITIYDNDVNQGLFNPASINAEMNKNLAINYSNHFGAVTYGSAAFAYKLKNNNAFQLGINYVNHGEFDGYNENDTKTETFTGSEMVFSGGYAIQIPETNIHVGINGKFISSNLESYSSTGGAIDLGAIYVNKKNRLNCALVIRNIGRQFTTYAGFKEEFKEEIIFGISKELEYVPIRWHLSLENLQQWNIGFSNPNRATTTLEGNTEEEKVSVLGNAFRHVIIGMEFLPKKAFNIRLSYNFRRAEELKIVEQRNFSGLSLGFGLKMNNLKFNYSYSLYTLAANTSAFGLTINFQ